MGTSSKLDSFRFPAPRQQATRFQSTGWGPVQEQSN